MIPWPRKVLKIHPPKKSRSRRLQKKLHIGEFKELGFEFVAEIKATQLPEAEDALIDALLDEVIEPRRLAMGGSISGAFIARFGRGSVSEADRNAVESWLQARPEIGHVKMGPLVDNWYDFD